MHFILFVAIVQSHSTIAVCVRELESQNHSANFGTMLLVS